MSTKIENAKDYNYRSLICEKEYIKLLCAQLISRFGDAIDTIAYSWLVYKLTGSATFASVLFVVNALPNLIFSMTSGVISNYFKKKNIIVICDFGRGFVVSVTALMLSLKILEPWHLFIFTFLNSTFETFRQPSSMAIYSLVVPKEKMDYARSLDSSLSKTIELVGYACASFLIALLGVSGVIFIDALTFLICGFIILSVIVKNEYIKDELLTLKGYFLDIKEGLLYVKNQTLILNMIIFGSVFNMFVVPINSLQAIYVGNVLKGDSFVLGLFSSGLLVGMIAGGILVPILKKKTGGHFLFVLSGICIGLGYMGLSMLHLVSLIFVKYFALFIIVFCIGLSVPMLSTQASVVLLTKTEKEYLPRVGALFNMLVLCATPLGGMVTGILTRYVTIPNLFLMCSCVIIALSILQIWNKTLKNL